VPTRIQRYVDLPIPASDFSSVPQISRVDSASMEEIESSRKRFCIIFQLKLLTEGPGTQIFSTTFTQSRAKLRAALSLSSF
jgi:hypothetical protein